jgi:hypothetical protein
MASLHRRQRRRAAVIVLTVPLAAVLVGSTACRAGSARIRTAWRALVRLLIEDCL